MCGSRVQGRSLRYQVTNAVLFGSAPQGAVHLSYFLRDQLYPGIRDKNGSRAFQVGGKVSCRHLALKDRQVPRFLRGEKN